MRKFVLFLCLILIFTTGCTSSVNTTLKLGFKKYSASVKTVIKYDGDLSDSDDLYALTVMNNYKKFTSDSDKIKIKKNEIIVGNSVKNLRKEDLDLSHLGFVSNLPSGRFIDVNKNFFVTSYNIDMIYNYPSIEEKVKIANKTDVVNGGLKPEYLQQYGDASDIVNSQIDEQRADLAQNFENNLGYEPEDASDSRTDKNYVFDAEKLSTTFVVSLPTFASYNNADDAVGFNYTWNIRKDMPTVIRMQYVVYSSFSIGFVLILGILALIYFARRILKHDALKRIDSNRDIEVDKEE